MRIFRLFVFYPILLFFLLGFVQNAYSFHIMGGEVTYRFLDQKGPSNAPYRFRIEFDIYINCQAVYVNGLQSSDGYPPGGSTLSYGIYNALDSTPVILRTTSEMEAKKTWTQVLPEIPPNCHLQSLTNLCIDHYVWVDTVTLASSLFGYYIASYTYARNASISNLVTPSIKGQTFYTYIPSTIFENNSPQFTNSALPYICSGDTISVLNSAYDPDGDHLIYSFSNPVGLPSGVNAAVLLDTFKMPQSLAFLPGYTLSQPFGPGSYAYINPATGITRFYAPNQGQYVVSVEIQEYRAGYTVPLSTTHRDLQIFVGSTCPVIASPIINTQNYTVNAGDSLSFSVTATNQVNDSIQLVANGPILDGSDGYKGKLANFTPGKGLPKATAYFSWRPACNQQGTYQLTAEAIATGCPPKSAFSAINITVLPYSGPSAIFGKDTVCNNVSKQMYFITPKAKSTYIWSVTNGTIVGSATRDTVFILWNAAASSGTVSVKETTPYCSGTTTQTVLLAPVSKIKTIGDTTICAGQSVKLVTTGAVSYNWSPATGLSSNSIASPIASPVVTTTYIVSNTSAGLNCILPDTVKVSIISAGNVLGTDTVTCSGVPIKLGLNPVANFKYQWSPGSNLSSDSIANPVFTVSITDSVAKTFNYTVTAASTIAAQCKYTKNILVTVNPQPVSNPVSSLYFCSGANYAIGQPSFSTFLYSWSSAKFLSDSTTNRPVFTAVTDTGFTKRYILTKSYGSCKASDTLNITVIPNIAYAGRDTLVCSGNTILLGEKPVKNFTYRWSPVARLSDSVSSSPVYTAINTDTVASRQLISVIATSTLNAQCHSTDTIAITVNPQPTSNGTTLLLACSPQAYTLGKTTVRTFKYQWSPGAFLSDSTIFNPVYQHPVSVTLNSRYVLTKSFGTCFARDTVNITNIPQVANAGTDRLFCSGKSAALGSDSVAGFSYRWSPGFGLSDSLSAKTTVKNSITDTTARNFDYIVTATSQLNNQCFSRDTVQVTVDPQPVGVPFTSYAFCTGAVNQIGKTTTSTFQYSWSPGRFLSDSLVATPNFSQKVSQADTNLYVLNKSFKSCSANDTFRVIVVPNVANAGISDSICGGSSIVIGSAPVAGFIYQWAPALFLSDSATALTTATLPNDSVPYFKTFTVKATSVINPGCFSTDSVKIKALPQPASFAPATYLICSGDSITIGHNGYSVFTYIWSPSAGLVSPTKAQTEVLSKAADSIYTKTYYLSKSYRFCRATDTILIKAEPRPVIDTIWGNPSVCPGVTGIKYWIPHYPWATYSWGVTGGSFAVSPAPTDTAVSVNWGDSTNTAGIWVVATSNFGCQALDTTRLSVTIKRRLKTQTPVGPTDFCIANADSIGYAITPTVNSIYKWKIIGGNFINSMDSTAAVTVNWTTVGKVGIWIEQNVVTTMAQCFGRSDTLYISVHPQPDTIAAILQTGNPLPGKLCGNQADTIARVVYKVPSPNQGSVYQWNVKGGQILSSNGGDSIQVLWKRFGLDTIIVQETSVYGCIGVPKILVINLYKNPITTASSYDSTVCPPNLTNLTYQVLGGTGSTYNWTISGGSIISNNQTGTVVVDWQPNGSYLLNVTETTSQGCTGNTLSFSLIYDNSNLGFNDVSCNFTDDKVVDLYFQLQNTGFIISNISIMRRSILPDTSAWQNVASLPKTDTFYVDTSAITDAKSYQYQLQAYNKCGSLVASSVHNSVLLGSSANQETSTAKLTFNKYIGFPNGVNHYEVYRKVDQQTDFVLYDILDSGTVTKSYVNGTEGFTQCYRVKALAQNYDRYSWSNISCIVFENPLELPNVFTPNNDNVNDYFVIKNLQLYPNNNFTVYNRWGAQVYHKDSYNNEWGGEGLVDGVYFYLFRLTNNNKEYKGWVQILK